MSSSNNSNRGNLRAAEALAALCGGQQSDGSESKGLQADGPSSVATSTADGVGNSSKGNESQSRRAQESSMAALQQNPLQNVGTPQQQQQLQQVLAAARLQQQQQQQGQPNNNNNNNNAALAQSLLLSGLPQQGLGNAVEQYALQHYLQQAQNSAAAAAAAQQQAQQVAFAKSLGAYGDANQALVMAALTGNSQQLQNVNTGSTQNTSVPQQVIPSASGSGTDHSAGSSAAGAGAAVDSPSVSSMKPPLPPSASNSVSTVTTSNLLSNPPPTLGGTNHNHHNHNHTHNHNQHHHQSIAPMPRNGSIEEASMMNMSTDEKKQNKRAANRKSAQLSRKRKKQYIEELKEENEELRRKEQILCSIPDLIVVFDSSGKLGFVSQSVSRFLNIPAAKLLGKSFWERMCHDSVRLLKAAFMDALAAREPNSDTAPLGSGIWELRLLDKDSKYILVTLNGVVHFTGESPECVCCIRPASKKHSQQGVATKRSKVKVSKQPGRLVSSSDGSRSSDDSGNSTDPEPRIQVNPNQSVMSSGTTTEENSAEDESSPQKQTSPSRKKIGNGSYSGGEDSESSTSEDEVPAAQVVV